MVVLACTLMIKFKLSYLIFGAVIVALVHVLVLVRDNFKIQKGLIILVCLSGVLFVPWLARGYITSGYPFYPEAFLGLRVDWRVPAQNANGLKKVIYSFARDPTKLPDQVLGNNDWLGPWIERNAKEPANIRAFLLISTGLISFILSLLIRSSPEIRFLQLFVLAPRIAWRR